MRGWAAYLMAMLLALSVLPVAAAAAAFGPDDVPALRSGCFAVSTPAEPLATLAAGGTRWRCGAGEPPMAAERAVLRFALPDDSSGWRYFATRPSLFEALTLAVVKDGKIVALRRLPAGKIDAGPYGRRFLVALPEIPAGADAVLVAFDRATTRGLYGDAQLFAADPTEGHRAMRGLLLAAIVCGMLIMPLAFNASYYRVLREKFILWHLVLTVSLLAQCLLSSGIVGHFVDVPLPVFGRLGILTFGITVAAAAAFGAAFIEPGKLDPRLRKGLYLAAAQVLVVSLAHTMFPGFARPVQTPLYFASFIPVIAIFILVLVDAWRRGSRAVRYQLVGWAPFLAVGVIRIVTMLNVAMPFNEAMPLFYAAMVVESIAVSLGVADRFLSIKRQRDRALSRAQTLERLSERDDLTGLYNRRALDGPLGNFAAQEFTGFALFDLDNFKRVNDTHGHATGDAVLRTFASVLSGDEDAVALRMGGEEFLLLLRGDRVAERVERLREAIPVRIAREVAELELLVTASAGLVEAAPGNDIGGDFVALYRAADDLLYEAKHNGRNLLAAMRLQPAPIAAATGAAAA